MNTPHYEDDSVTVYAGDCLDVMAGLADQSIDAVITDPPYGLEFMGKEWDAPWKHGFGETGYSDGKRMPRPNHSSTRNPMCRTCRKHQRGTKRCACAAPDYDERPADSGIAYQQWCEQWATECLRLLKPGGHLLAFGGTRTHHRLASAIEDAGFEIRDTIAWLYGSGFSKSWNFSTQYDGKWCNCAGNSDLHSVRQDIPAAPISCEAGEGTHLFEAVQRNEPGQGLGDARPQGISGAHTGIVRGGSGEDARRAESGMEGRQLHRTREGLPDDSETRSSAGTGERLRGRTSASDGEPNRAHGNAAGRSASRQSRSGRQPAGELEAVSGSHIALDDRALRRRPTCPQCGGLDQAFKGFGTGLKPSHEPIVVARKPLAGTVASNVQQYGTGAINIDACRVGINGGGTHCANRDEFGKCRGHGNAGRSTSGETFHGADSASGRWPPNVAVDDEMAAEIDKQSGYSGPSTRKHTAANEDDTARATFGLSRNTDSIRGHDDAGGSSRFFPTFKYSAKAPTSERPTGDGIAHPTVKPLDLMRWLVRLVTPPNGLVLDPFAGTGTTAEACIHEYKRCIAIEREPDYLPLIVARLTKPLAIGFDFEEPA